MPPKITVRGAISIAGVLLQAVIKGDNVQDVQVLALVFVEALDLDVEQRFGIDPDAGLFLDEAGQIPLVFQFDLSPALLKFGIVGQGSSFLQFLRSCPIQRSPIRLADQSGQTGDCTGPPSAAG